MRKLLRRIELMSRILKKLKALLKSMSDERGSISYPSHEMPKVYPFRFSDNEAREANERKLAIYLTLIMYE